MQAALIFKAIYDCSAWDKRSDAGGRSWGCDLGENGGYWDYRGGKVSGETFCSVTGSLGGALPWSLGRLNGGSLEGGH